jgi:hypothetical protein
MHGQRTSGIVLTTEAPDIEQKRLLPELSAFFLAVRNELGTL